MFWGSAFVCPLAETCLHTAFYRSLHIYLLYYTAMWSYLFTVAPSGSGSVLDNLDKLEGKGKNRHHKFTILDQPMAFQFIDGDQTKTGLNSESLVIKPGVLRQGLTYFVGVKVVDEGRWPNLWWYHVKNV